MINPVNVVKKYDRKMKNCNHDDETSLDNDGNMTKSSLFVSVQQGIMIADDSM